jgi:methionine-rich copper-binding protein CopC
VLVALVVLVVLGAGPAGASPAAPRSGVPVVHARIVGSSPANGQTVARPPVSVALDLDAKPATLEGDPIGVWGPDGTRVDTGEPRVDVAGRRVTVDLRSGGLPAGAYLVVYRVISGDSHLVAGRFTFRAESAAPAPSALVAPADASPSSPMGRAALDRGQRRILAAAGLVGALALVLPHSRRRHARDA